MKELELEATVENLDKVISFVEKELEGVGCSMKVMMQISVAVEEIYVNIAHYAYPDGVGMAKIALELAEDKSHVTIAFTDSGTPYNPLETKEPDITLSAEERPIGGLGIFMVKKSMDDVQYEYRDGQNILTIIKNM